MHSNSAPASSEVATLSFHDVPSCGPLSAFWTCRLGTHLELSGRAALWSTLCFPDPHRDGWGEFPPIEVHVSIGLRKTVENAFQNTQRIYRNQPCVKPPKREPGAEPTMDGWEFLPPISPTCYRRGCIALPLQQPPGLHNHSAPVTPKVA